MGSVLRKLDRVERRNILVKIAWEKWYAAEGQRQRFIKNEKTPEDTNSLCICLTTFGRLLGGEVEGKALGYLASLADKSPAKTWG